MKVKRFGKIFLFFAGIYMAVCFCPQLAAASDMDKYFEDDNATAENGADMGTGQVSDPLEPMNRMFFQFNDKLYFWVLKPLATGYGAVLPEDFRIAIRNAFDNLMSPVRIVNNMLQGKVKESGVEFSRFLINTVGGVAGLGDPARQEFGIMPQDEDLGQTLGTYGAGPGIYICWPVFGPSNVRDTFGRAGDAFLDITSYLTGGNVYSAAGLKAGERVNNTSLTLGDYEDFKEAAIDPYVSMRDIYMQYRESKIKDRLEDKPKFSLAVPAGREPAKDTVSAPVTGRTRQQTVPHYYINVGTFIEKNNVDAQQQRLSAIRKESVIREYDRGDYTIYGVEVPAGDSFMNAKIQEIEMASLGFHGAFVVTR